MKGIAAFFTILLVTSSVSAVTLDLGTLNTVGSLTAALASTTGLDVVISSSTSKALTLTSDTNWKSVSITGLASLIVSPGTTLKIEKTFNVAAGAVAVIKGKVETAAADATSTATATINGLLDVQSGAVSNFNGGLIVVANAVVNVAGDATLQVGGAKSAVNGVVNLAEGAVISYVQTTCTLAGGIYTTGSAFVKATSATVTITATATIQAGIAVAGNAIVQAEASAVAVAAIAATAANNVIIAAKGYAFTAKQEVTVAADAAVTFVGNFVAENKVTVDGFVEYRPANGDNAIPSIAGALTVAIGGRLRVSANTELITYAQAVIEGTLVLAAGAKYTAAAAAQTVATLVVEAAVAVVAAAQGASILIYNYSAVIQGAVAFAGNVVVVGAV